MDNSIIKCIHNEYPEILGKCDRMRFECANDGKDEWYEGVVSSYDIITGRYSIYFPSDGPSEQAYLDDEDMEIMN